MFSYFIRTTTDAGGTIPSYILAVLAVWGVLYGCLTAVTDRKITWHLFLVLAFQVVLLLFRYSAFTRRRITFLSLSDSFIVNFICFLQEKRKVDDLHRLVRTLWGFDGVCCEP